MEGVNADPHALLDLCFALLDGAGILPYYFYMCDMIPFSEHWRVSVAKAQQLQHAIMGYLPGFATPRIVCDVPFVGKRWVHQLGEYDRERGISYWTKNYRTSIERDDPSALDRTLRLLRPDPHAARRGPGVVARAGRRRRERPCTRRRGGGPGQPRGRRGAGRRLTFSHRIGRIPANRWTSCPREVVPSPAMSMEVTAWMSLYHAMNAQEDRRPFSRATLRRIAGVRPAAPRPAGRVPACSASSTAVLAVATPVLAGRVVDAIVDGDDAGGRDRAGRADRGHRGRRGRRSGCSTRWLSAQHRRGPDPRPAHARCSTTCSGCRSRSSPAPAPARWSAGSTTT